MAGKKNKINKEQVKHIANLARIKLSDKEITKFQKQLANIIDYFDLLNEVETEHVDETSQVTGLVNMLRKDEIRDILSQKHALQNAPDEKKGYFKTKSPLKKRSN